MLISLARRVSRSIQCMLFALAIAIAVPVSVHAEELTRFDIPAQDLGAALREFAKAAHQQIVFDSQRVQGLRSAPLSGSYSVEGALRILLASTGLSLSKTAAGVYYVEAKKDVTSGARPDTSSSPDKEGIEEIIVTAQKRSERLQDVPVPVTVLSAVELADNDQNRLQDYFLQIPGLSLVNGGGGAQFLEIRGLSTGIGANPTVGVTIDDVPYGSSTFLGFGNGLIPDIDPSDLARIEVLRGPQGALYGADSMGGLIKYVTKDPSAEAISGRLQVIGDSVVGGEFGFGARGSVNIPLSDTFAIRASGFTRRDPGYIDNVLTGGNDVNRVDVSGGRLSALWRPSDTISLKVSALLQKTHGYGTPTIDADSSLQPTYGYQDQALLRGTGGYTADARLYTATLTGKFGGIDFISVTGYGDNTYMAVGDYTASYGSTSQYYFGEPFSGANLVNNFQTKKVTEEFRLSSESGQAVEWLAGAFYLHESTASYTSTYGINPATGSAATALSPPGLLIEYDYPTTLSDYALFGDLTVHFTDRFDVQVGGRESESRQVYNETDTGQLVPPYFNNASSPFVNQTQRADGNAFTYLLTPRFKISPDLMAYARLSSGYRFGGNNINAVVYNVPAQYAPDKTNNYELGIKAELLDHTMTVNASAYYIAWKHIQFDLGFQTGTYVENAGAAKSQGLELSVQARPTTGLSITAAVSENDAQLTQDLPQSDAIGFAGTRLPYSASFSGSVSVDQDIALVSNWVGFVGGSLSYIGSREGEFATIYAPVRFRLPAYADVAFRMGARYRSLMVNLFANNALNRRGVIGGGPTYGGEGSPFNAIYIQPRTMGLSVTKSF